MSGIPFHVVLAPDTGAGTGGTTTTDAPEGRIPEDLSGVSATDLARAEKDLIKAYRAARRKAETDAEAMDEALSIYDDITRVKAEQTARSTAATERAEKLRELDSQIGLDEKGGTLQAPAAETTDTAEPAVEAPAATAGGPSVDAPESLAASGGRATVADVRDLRQPAGQLAPNSGLRTGETIVAAGNLRNVSAGYELTREAWAQEMANKASSMSLDSRAKSYVGKISRPVPEDRLLLPRDPIGNSAKIEKVFGEDAIMGRLAAAGGRVSAMVASGGLPGPFPADYTYEATAVTDRPIQGCLGRFAVGSERGGVNFLQPPTLASVSSGVGVWTHGTDASPGGSTKARVAINPATPQSVVVDAITFSMQIGNFERRFLPEEFTGTFGQLQAFHARLAEANILNSIAAASTTVWASQELGFARDIMTHSERLAAALRNRLRTNPQMPVQTIWPAWVRNAMRADLVKEPDITSPGLTSPADDEIEGFFDKEYLAPCWTYDSETTLAAGARTVTDGITFNGSDSVASASSGFGSVGIGDQGAAVTGTGIPASTTVLTEIAPVPVAAIANIAQATTVVTITTEFPHGLSVGQVVTVVCSNAAVNGTVVVATVPSTTTFTYAYATATIASTPATGSVTSLPTAILSANATASGTAVSLTITGAAGSVPSQIFPVQAAGPIQRWPALAIGYMFVPGTMLFVDGGTYDLGIEIADSLTTATNGTFSFAETFEATAFRGIEAYRILAPVWVSGQASAAIPLGASTVGL